MATIMNKLMDMAVVIAIVVVVVMDAEIIEFFYRGGHSKSSSPHLKWENEEKKIKKGTVGKIISY